MEYLKEKDQKINVVAVELLSEKITIFDVLHLI